MKSLSIKQPWANMIVSGRKTIETRTWWTAWRGWFLICSSKVPAIAPAGFGLAFARLIDCRRMTGDDCAAACCELYERAKALVLADVTPIIPITIRGAMGFFDLDDRDLARRIRWTGQNIHSELSAWLHKWRA